MWTVPISAVCTSVAYGSQAARAVLLCPSLWGQAEDRRGRVMPPLRRRAVRLSGAESAPQQHGDRRTPLRAAMPILLLPPLGQTRTGETGRGAREAEMGDCPPLP